VSPLIGARVRRREDPRLVTGHGRYVDDLALPNLLHISILRSPYAHARIKEIDTGPAASCPGVVAVLLRSDFEPVIHSFLRVNGAANLAFNPPQFPIAGDEVVFQGEPVGVVVAENRYAADDAANSIQIDYEPLPCAIDVLRAADSESPRVHESSPTNTAWDVPLKDVRGGNIDLAFGEADVIVRERIVQQRVFPLPMEGRVVVAEYQRFDNQLTLWTSCQAPYFVKRALAEALGLTEARVRVISNDVGGGFGAKIRPYPEDYLAAGTSKLVGAPVKWVESRTEGLTATTHGRAEVFDIEAAARRDGTLLGLKVTQYQDLGAYVGFFQTSQTIAVELAGGCYNWKAMAGRSLGILTNTTSTDPYRGAGRPEATHIAERAIDLLARQINMDPADLRKRNLIDRAQFPVMNNFGITYDSGNYREALDLALERVGYLELRRQQSELRRAGRYIGIGIATYLEICGFGPSKLTAGAVGVALVESAEVRIDPTGAVTAFTGVHAHGQGHETSFAQVIADTLGVSYESVTIRHGDTQEGPALGLGTYGSRSLSVGGTAILRACRKVLDKARALAAHMLEVSEQDLDFDAGTFRVKGAPSRGVTLNEVAARAYGDGFRDGSGEHGLEAIAYFDPPSAVFPFGTHIAVVEVDVETGSVHVQRYVAVDDCGNIVNPLIVEGQIHGGITQGLGQALFEEVVYDAETGQLRTGTLIDYLIPTANEVPAYELAHTVTPSPHNDMGVKGVGEAGTIGSSVAIINAICDALLPFGITHVDMPAGPERIWRQIRESRH